MQRMTLKYLVLFMAVGLMVLGAVRLADASPQYGGECSYCHNGDDSAAFTITGETAVVDGVKLFEVERGGQVDFGFDVDNPGVPDLSPLRGAWSRSPQRYRTNTARRSISHSCTPQIPLGIRQARAASSICSGQASSMARAPIPRPQPTTIILRSTPRWHPESTNSPRRSAAGSHVRATGQTPSGGWGYNEDFLLRVIPEPTSVMLLVLGAVALCFGRCWRRWVVPVALVAATVTLANTAAYAYPSRSGDCAICHSIPGPSDQTGDFEIKNAAGEITDSIFGPGR